MPGFQWSVGRGQSIPAPPTTAIVRRRRVILRNHLRGKIVVSQVPKSGFGASAHDC